ncbi:hypothetical protein HD806DRAFT_421838 [Xylariaceae sp. AK1471]|nr:hypothetical protein HD806DRAFT_421838 [Xylariaceae sp. AK1471]
MKGIEELEAVFTTENIFACKLLVQSAFHLCHMLFLEKSYRSTLEQHIEKQRGFVGNVLFVSAVAGAKIKSANQLGPEHWVLNMTHPMLFSDSFNIMVATEYPDGSIVQHIGAITEPGFLISQGYLVDTSRVNAPDGQRGLRVVPSLSSYPWNHAHRFGMSRASAANTDSATIRNTTCSACNGLEPVTGCLYGDRLFAQVR